jgi:Icc-related predicted phosphoesterase
MKIQIASDLHLEFLEHRFPHYRAVERTDADVLVIAGDIHRQGLAVSAFRDWGTPVIYVHGNHEPYGAHYDETVSGLRAACAGTDVRYLECDAYAWKGVRFLGCCLWTDYQLVPEQAAPAMNEAEMRLNDHRLIRTNEGPFSARDAAWNHARSRAWLETELDQPFDGATVVVTHHAPHANSIHSRFAGSLLNAAFVSNLTPLIRKADLWIHGHVHDSFDYQVDGTRVIANPRGYALNHRQAASEAELDWENPDFIPDLVVELPDYAK